MGGPYPCVHLGRRYRIEQAVGEIRVRYFFHRSGVDDVQSVGLSDGREILFAPVLENPVARETVSFGFFERAGLGHPAFGYVVSVDRRRSEIPQRVADDVEIMARNVDPAAVFREFEMRGTAFRRRGGKYLLRIGDVKIRNLSRKERGAGKNLFADEVVQMLASEFFAKLVRKSPEGFGFEPYRSVFGGGVFFERFVFGKSRNLYESPENPAHARVDEHVPADFPAS